MEIATLFTEQKWKILESISHEKLSPLQLAGMTGTTMANISQQLRLLEAANLVKKEKIKNRDKGKPRTLFSLTHDYTYLISTMQDFAQKKLIVADAFHKTFMRILYLEDTSLHYYVAKFIWQIESYLDNISVILMKSNDDSIGMLIACENPKSLEKKVSAVSVKKPHGESKDFKIQCITLENFSRQLKDNKLEGTQIIYDPKGIATAPKEVVPKQ